MSPDRLYGPPFAEYLHSDPCDVWNYDYLFVDPAEFPPEGVIIEEWSVRPTTCPPDSAEYAAERHAEWIVDDGEWTEDGADNVYAAAAHPDVVAAFQEALDLFYSKITYRMADKLIAEHRITLDADGEPLMNGARMFPEAAPKVEDHP